MSAATIPQLRFEGAAWVFGDEVNTDDMYPGFAMRLPLKEAARHMFNASRADWPTLVRPGDIVVGGKNFGLGSSRPAPLLYLELGVRCVVAEQFNSLFYRNCLNSGLAAVTVPDVRNAVTEGDRLVVDLEEGELVNVSSGRRQTLSPMHDFLLLILRAGGIIPQLEASGRLAPRSGLITKE